jgi:hypothetical protein
VKNETGARHERDETGVSFRILREHRRGRNGHQDVTQRNTEPRRVRSQDNGSALNLLAKRKLWLI